MDGNARHSSDVITDDGQNDFIPCRQFEPALGLAQGDELVHGFTSQRRSPRIGHGTGCVGPVRS